MISIDISQDKKHQAKRLKRFKCCACSKVELAAGGSCAFRCKECRESGRISDSVYNRRAFDAGTMWAGGLVQVEIRHGRIPHPTNLKCADCGCQAIEYDHRDYNKPLSVDPVCRGCNLNRGPAIPLPASLTKILSYGRAPYALKKRTQQLFNALGIPTDCLDAFPKKLTADHWRTFIADVESAILAMPHFLPVPSQLVTPANTNGSTACPQA